MINVLVTGVGGGVGQGIIKSLRLIKDMEINILAADMSPLAAGFYGADKCFLVPEFSNPDYFKLIEGICIEHAVDYYFPGTDVELKSCSIKADYFLKTCSTKIVISPIQVIDIADDKLLTAKFLFENGFSAPKTWLPNEAWRDDVTYPVIVKPRVGCRSIGVTLANNDFEANSAMSSLSDPIVQEYIDGYEYTCTVVVIGDYVSDVLCLKRDLRAGDTYRAFPEKDSTIEGYVKEVALKLGVYGSCNFQLRVVSGIPKIFEINSRFSGTTPFCAQLGFNPVECFLKNDRNIEYVHQVDYDSIVLRHWAEVAIRKSDLPDPSVRDHFVIKPISTSKML